MKNILIGQTDATDEEIKTMLRRKIEMFFLERQEKKLHIKYIKELLARSSKRHSNDINSRLFYIEEDLKKAEAKTADEYEDDDGEDDNGKPIIRHFYGCPVCHRTIYSSQINYCNNCGQRLTFKRYTI